MDPIFDLATDLSQADAILPHSSKLHIYHQSQWGKIGDKCWYEAMSNSERPMEEIVRPWTSLFFAKILSKIPKTGSMTGWHLKPRSFHSSTTQDIMVDTFKFTSKSKVWNNFYAGYSIRKLPAHLSPDLYSGRAKGQVCGILLTLTNDQFWPSTPAQKGIKMWNC